MNAVLLDFSMLLRARAMSARFIRLIDPGAHVL